MPEEFTKAFWEDRYSGHNTRYDRPPNPQLLAEAGDLAPGTALDAGCGEGADAIWLASQGWRVTAVDIAATALRHGRECAEALGAEVAGRIDFEEVDLTDWTPPEGHFDLVSTHYVHPAASREALFRRLAASVAPGGTFLVVGHHPSDPHTAGAHDAAPRVHFTADEVAAGLDPDRWDIRVAEARTRTVTFSGGREVTMRDAVLRARKRA
nr:class I SAM-dependent methyltransferase [Streptomyces sp. NBC_00857]